MGSFIGRGSQAVKARADRRAIPNVKPRAGELANDAAALRDATHTTDRAIIDKLKAVNTNPALYDRNFEAINNYLGKDL